MGGGRYGLAMTAKEKLLERAPSWSETQAEVALRAVEREEVDLNDVSGLDGGQLTAILDRIPGARERARESIEQARRGETIPLEEL